MHSTGNVTGLDPERLGTDVSEWMCAWGDKKWDLLSTHRKCLWQPDSLSRLDLARSHIFRGLPEAFRMTFGRDL